MNPFKRFIDFITGAAERREREQLMTEIRKREAARATQREKHRKERELMVNSFKYTPPSSEQQRQLEEEGKRRRLRKEAEDREDEERRQRGNEIANAQSVYQLNNSVHVREFVAPTSSYECSDPNSSSSSDSSSDSSSSICGGSE